VAAARAEIAKRFGPAYVPDTARIYKNKAKNAQEAHECIRPTDMAADPDSLRLADADQRRLYDLIWKRTLASQMAAARMERTTVDILSPDAQVGFRATGQVVQFDGFLKIYDEGRDDEEEDDARLPQLANGEALDKRKVQPDQHFTQPPPRYTEATLVKRMEELGIGRPSTYASVLTTIVDREYVKKDKNRLFPEDKGRLVTAFLANYFHKYVEYDFTADLETELDDVSAGERDYKDVLTRFWRDFSAAVAETADLRIGEVLEKIDEFLAPHLYPLRADGSDPRSCPTCGSGRLHLKTARSGGAFIGCGNYPECRYTRPISSGDEQGAVDGRVLGQDAAGHEISLRAGRFGPYVQRGEATEAQPKPDRASLPKGWAADALTLERALELLSLPRQIGPHPDDGQMIEAAIGRFGPYVKHGTVYANIAEVEEVFTIGMNRAVEVLALKAARGPGRGAAAEPLRVLGDHPDGGPVQVMPGKFGPYVKWEKVNATLPKELTPEAVTLDEALVLIAEKAGKSGGKKKAAPKKVAAKAAGAKKAPAKKPAAKKPAAKRPVAKKAPAKKATADE
jgi:DNA topoisomerase-1